MLTLEGCNLAQNSTVSKQTKRDRLRKRISVIFQENKVTSHQLLAEVESTLASLELDFPQCFFENVVLGESGQNSPLSQWYSLRNNFFYTSQLPSSEGMTVKECLTCRCSSGR